MSRWVPLHSGHSGHVEVEVKGDTAWQMRELANQLEVCQMLCDMVLSQCEALASVAVPAWKSDANKFAASTYMPCLATPSQP